MKQLRVMGLALTAVFCAGQANAEELTGTLKNIKETGTITIGYRDSSIPFSYLDDNQKPIGFAIDICYKKSSKLNSIDDLRGKSVASSSGTTNIKQLTEANAARNLGINIIPAKEHAESFLMVETDRAVATVLDDILLASFVAGSKDPDAYVISTDAFSKPEPYGIMLRKDDPAFKKVVDAATAALYQSAEGQKLYDKWFMQKIPPKGLNLNAPISAELKHEFAKPSDSPDPDSYKAM